jgi:hypothetical protein
MKFNLRATLFLATAVAIVSVLFLAPEAASKLKKKVGAVGPHATSGSRQTRTARSSRNNSEVDYSKSLGKSLRLARKESPKFTFAQQEQTPAVQEPKLAPDVAEMVGPASQDRNLRDLPYIPPTPQEEEEVRLMRHPPTGGQVQAVSDPLLPARATSLATNMADPSLTFGGLTQNQACGSCLPPDTDGDVGSGHYIQTVNSSIRIHDKSGNVLAGPITYNSFFSALGAATPCGNSQNQGDGIVFYDHIADRWVVSDFAFGAFPGTAFYQCVGVSKNNDPVAGGWWLYAVQVDPANNSFLGDYPKFGLWPDGYYLSVNLFSNNTTFNGVRVYALDRNAMINGGPANTIAFTITPADLGDQYSLVPATFRHGSQPPAGQPEWFMDINSSAAANTVETQVFVRRFHADFVTPANSTFGVGASHTPDGTITVNGFVDAFTTTTAIAPNGTATTTQFLDTLGDKLMYPLVYQNRGGVESIYSSHTVNNNQNGTGPTGVRWYQFNMTGNTIPATPAQQQTFTNGADGLWRWMPSINVDAQGNLAIAYSASSTTVNPGIRYAGRLATDPASTMAQGEAVMTPGTGHQTSTSGRWGDYSSLFVDPTDGCTFWHTHEYFSVTSASAWNTRIGSFKFPGCTAGPLPTPSPTATPTPVPSPTPPAVAAGPVTVTATAGTPGPTDYASVKAAFDAINAGTHQGAINIFIVGDTTEAASAVLNASGSGGAIYTSILMQPTGVRTVSGNLALPLIDLNGADSFTIDGLNSGGNSLTISNTNTGAVAGTSTIRYINGATNNLVTRTTILGSSTVALATAGGTVVFSTDAVTTNGNDANTISNCDIGPAGANLPNKAIFGLGSTTTVAIRNSGNIIDNNRIFDFFNAGSSVSGIHVLSGNDIWTISSNRLYQTAARTFTVAALRYAGITLNSTAGTLGSFTLTGNTIGFGAANGTGTTTLAGLDNEFRGIDALSVNTTTASTFQGNTISGINQTSSRNSTSTTLSCFIGIAVGTGTNAQANVLGNFIGSLDASSGIVITETSTVANTAPAIMIYDFSLRGNTISSNKIGTVTINSGGTGTTVGFRGIFVNTSSATIATLNNNVIGGTAAGSITDNIVGSYGVYGIQTSLATVVAIGNTVRNLSGNSNGAALIVSAGFVMATSTGANQVSQNVIHSLSNASGAASNSIYAMSLSFPATANVVERNLIHSLSMTSSVATGQLVGIITSAAASTATYKNNMVRLGLDAAGNSVTQGLFLAGLWDAAGTNNFYFNSSYVAGSGVTASSSTFAFFSQVVTNVRNYQDNILWNARSNASGAGKNYAISVAGTTANPAGLTSNFNDLFATGTGSFVGLFNAIDQPAITDWRTATGQDLNSISADPKFWAPDAAAAAINLHLLLASPARLAGLTIAGVTNDFDNEPRPATTPDIGADQVGAPTAAPALITGTIRTSDGAALAGVTVNLSGAKSAKVITDANGDYRFNNVDTDNFYIVTPALVNYHFGPVSRSFSLLANQTDAVFTATRDTQLSGNAIDTPDYFVRQHYLDFLGREPDESGFNFWSDQISSCGADAGCVERRTINVSAAYFLSIEFHQTGGLVDGLYRASYGRRPQYAEFVPDSQSVAGGLIVGQGAWAQQLASNKRAFIDAWVERPEFHAAYDGLTNAAFVATLLGHTGVDFSPSERTALVQALNSGSLNRTDVLSEIVNDERFVAAKRNETFVMMEYFGYLRRDPDESGYQFWLRKLNDFGGNFEQAEMVKAFINSGEYRARFNR